MSFDLDYPLRSTEYVEPDDDRFDVNYHWVMRWMDKSKILEESTGPLTEVQGDIIDSCLNRRDLKAAKQYIQDWNNVRARGTSRKADISKWTPGDHYYALNAKFTSLSNAIEHLNTNGYTFSGKIVERFQYKENGG